jgi:hypothetical protein
MKQGSNQKVLPNSGQPTKELRHGPNGLKLRALSPPRSPFWRIAQGTQTERFEGGIDRHDFFCTHSGLKPNHDIFRQCCQAIPKSGRSLGLPENFQRRDVAPNRQISRTESRETWPLEPDWSSLGHFSEAQSRRERLDRELTPERGRGQMLSLWLRLQTEPHRLSDQR